MFGSAYIFEREILMPPRDFLVPHIFDTGGERREQGFAGGPNAPAQIISTLRFLRRQLVRQLEPLASTTAHLRCGASDPRDSGLVDAPTLPSSTGRSIRGS